MWERRPGRLLGRFERPRDVSANMVINGDFQVAQRGPGPFTSASTVVNNDDAYLLDMWVFLANGSDTCDVSQETTVANLPTGGVAAIKLEVETGSRKFGIFQPIENANCRAALGGTVSLSFKAAVNPGSIINSIRVGILSWDSTVDTVTSDVVSAWNAAGTNPTLVANWTYENTPENLTMTGSGYQAFTLENVAIDTASAANIGVFIWVDDTDAAVDDTLHVTDVTLLPGGSSVSTPTHLHPNISSELTRCQRYLYVIRGFISAATPFAAGFNSSTTTASFVIPFPVTMRTFPSGVVSPLVSAANTIEVFDTGAITVVSSTGISYNHMPQYGSINVTVASGLADGNGSLLMSATTAAMLVYTAEL